MTSMSSRLDAWLVREMAAPVAAQRVRRRIDPRTGQALVILGHAIEYLADQFAYEAAKREPHPGQLEAIRLLMGKNRDLYLACPEVPTFWQRLRFLFHPSRRSPVGDSDVGSELSHGRV